MKKLICEQCRGHDFERISQTVLIENIIISEEGGISYNKTLHFGADDNRRAYRCYDCGKELPVNNHREFLEYIDKMNNLDHKVR